MIKKRILLLALCLLTAMLLPFNAAAQEKVNTAEKGSFSLSFTAGEEKAAGAAFKIYRIADFSEADAYAVTEQFQSYPISYDDIADADSWRNFAQTLLGYIASDGIAPDFTAVTNDNGIAYFNHLPLGLYLVSGSQYISDELIYTPQSFMISVPSMDLNSKWQYDLDVEVKYDITFDSENGEDNSSYCDIEILKIWKDNGSAYRPAEIEIEVYADDNLYDTVVLNKANHWKYKLEKLSNDVIWTVKERSVQTGYTVSVERQSNCFVLTNTLDASLVNLPNTAEPSSDNTADSLPQTGLLWWPVPCLLAGGLLAVIIGVLLKRGTANEG